MKQCLQTERIDVVVGHEEVWIQQSIRGMNL